MILVSIVKLFFILVSQLILVQRIVISGNLAVLTNDIQQNPTSCLTTSNENTQNVSINIALDNLRKSYCLISVELDKVKQRHQQQGEQRENYYANTDEVSIAIYLKLSEILQQTIDL